MKKEKIEFTILRYLGRPPSLFDDDAIAAVAKILANNPKFNWELFTEYATFHKLSQTLYPNLLTYNKREKGKGKREKEEELATSASGNAELQLGKKETPLAPARLAPLVPPSGRRCQASSDGGVVSTEPTTNIEKLQSNTAKSSSLNLGEVASLRAGGVSSASALKIPNKENTSGANPSFSLFPFPFSIPTSVVSHFRGIFLANAARNEFLAQELVKINKLMEDNGIEMLNWKGPTLAIQAYSDLSLRQFKDIDTLVKYEDLEKAKAILLENGFEDITPTRLPEYSAGRGYEFMHSKKKYELELEYSIFLARSVLDYDYNGMFNRPSSILVDKDQIKTLSIEDNLLFTSFHGTKHLWFRLRWLADILGKFELNKDEILLTIDSFKQKKLIVFCLYIAHKEFDLEESANFTNLHELLLRCKIKDLKQFGKIIHNRILQHSTNDSLLNHHQKATIIANLIAGNQNKNKYTKDIEYFNLWRRIRTKVMPSQADYNLVKLPKYLWLLYFIIRPIRIAKRGLKKLLS